LKHDVATQIACMAHFGYGLAAKDIPPAHRRIIFLEMF